MNAFPFIRSPAVFLEIGQSSLKVLEGNDGLELSLDRQENGRLTLDCAERLAESLQVFLKQHQWRSRLRAFCAIGARGVSLRRVSVPLTVAPDLRQFLALQIEREFPLPPEELAWGYLLLNGKAPPKNGASPVQEVMVIAVKRDVLQEYTDILSRCGLAPVFTLGALARSVVCPQRPAAFSVLDVGRKHSELAVFEQGVPMSIRLIPWGGENLTQSIQKWAGVPYPEAEKLKLQWDALPNPELAQTLQGGVQAEVEALARTLPRNGLGEKLYLTGASARFASLVPGLDAALGNGPFCVPIDTAGGEGRSAAVLGLKAECEQNGGLPSLVLDFHIPGGAEKSTARPAQWKWAALAGLLALVCVALRYVEPVIQTPRLGKRIADARARQLTLPKLDREVSFLRYLKTNQPPYLDLLHTLANAAPGGTRLESLSMNRRGDFTLRTSVRDGQQVADFRSKLIGSGLFAAVVVDEQTPTPDRQKLNVRVTGQWKALGDKPRVSPAAAAPQKQGSAASTNSSAPGAEPGLRTASGRTVGESENTPPLAPEASAIKAGTPKE